MLGASTLEGVGLGLFYPLLEYVQIGNAFLEHRSAKPVVAALAAIGVAPSVGAFIALIFLVIIAALVLKYGVFVLSARVYNPLMRDLRDEAFRRILSSHVFYFLGASSAQLSQIIDGEVDYVGSGFTYASVIASSVPLDPRLRAFRPLHLLEADLPRRGARRPALRGLGLFHPPHPGPRRGIRPPAHEAQVAADRRPSGHRCDQVLRDRDGGARPFRRAQRRHRAQRERGHRRPGFERLHRGHAGRRPAVRDHLHRRLAAGAPRRGAADLPVRRDAHHTQGHGDQRLARAP